MLVITNMTDKPLAIDGVSIDPGQQLSISHLTADMVAAKEAGTLRVLDGDETLEERRADIKAINEGIKRMGDV
jgi:hypothetical protein